MSTLTDKLSSIELLRQTIQTHGKMADDLLRKIEYKFRLECNYHSNKIEGGTLTKPETRSVMIGNITVAGKPLKDIREMKGHDEAMLDIFRLGKGEKRLSEKRMQDIHRQIIVAETPDEEQEIGRWKTTGNHIINYRGEKFQFTSPEDVPGAIHQLLNWLNANLDKIHSNAKDASHPLLLAFEFHLRYLTIHPFSDGNGRTARLLTNLVLVSLGYPPFWVAEGGEKDTYNRYLADVQAYGGSPDRLYEFLAGLVERSLKITLDAIEGKEIEDMDDWKKKVVLFKNSLTQPDALTVMHSDEAIESVYRKSIKPTLSKLIQEMNIYDDLFLRKQLWFGTGGGAIKVTGENDLDQVFKSNIPRHDVHFNYNLEGYKKSVEKQFQLRCGLIWKFDNYLYSLFLENMNTETRLLEKPYNVFYTFEEVNEIVRQCGSSMLKQLEQNTAQ